MNRPGSNTIDILVGKHVLVVDDQATPRMLVAASLENCGARVIQAETGEQALAVAQQETLDAFVLDINMPGLSGIELCRVLRNSPRYRNAPVIFVTGMAPSEMLQWAVDAGGDDFIRKPVQSVVLRTRLKSLLERCAYLAELELLNQSVKSQVSTRTEKIARTYTATGALPAPWRDEVCVVCSDVSSLSNRIDIPAPDELFRILSEELVASRDIAQRHGGCVEKAPGDAFMAVFEGADRISRGCDCALDILESTASRRALRRMPGPRVAIHAGPAAIGNLGTALQPDYGVLGAAVSIAARLCDAAEGTLVVASAAVREGAAGSTRLHFENERLVSLHGVAEPLAVFDLARHPDAP